MLAKKNMIYESAPTYQCTPIKWDDFGMGERFVHAPLPDIIDILNVRQLWYNNFNKWLLANQLWSCKFEHRWSFVWLMLH